MRRSLYKALIAAPAKIIAGVIALAGFIGSVWPERVRMFTAADVSPQSLAVPLLLAAVVYFLFLWLLKPSETTEAGQAHSTTGPNSHVIRAGGDVHFYGDAAPMERAKRKSSDRRLDDRRPTGLSRLTDAVQSGGTLASQVEQIVREQRRRCPELAIGQALHQIAANLGDANEENGFPEVRRQFRQYALEGRLDVWGQRQIRPIHLKHNQRSDVWSRIDSSHWESHGLHQRAASLLGEDMPHTENEELGRISGRYWNLRVRPDEIRRLWPNPTPPGGSGKS